MNRSEKWTRDESYSSYPRSRSTPSSFSSILFDAIYRSSHQSKSNLDKPHESKKSSLRLKHGVSVARTRDGKERKNMNHHLLLSETEKQKMKQKQPISPGSRIASFLSSLFKFNPGIVRKARMCHVGAVKDVNLEQKSVSSSTNSSISRSSCMRKKCSINNGVKRSVRFYPVSVILGEDDPNLMPILPTSVQNIRRSSSSSINVNELKNENRIDYNNHSNGEDDDDDDDLSYSSSDLFELDDLIGDWRYQEELPVYETTNLETNKAIISHAHRLCL